MLFKAEIPVGRLYQIYLIALFVLVASVVLAVASGVTKPAAFSPDQPFLVLSRLGAVALIACGVLEPARALSARMTLESGAPQHATGETNSSLNPTCPPFAWPGSSSATSFSRS